ncbi:glycosyltransferase family 4 protein [Dethiothermospora halolimnae]|uniref:glycosyltransferase family 4 protein n=1 Tax=Dethiothermospora halolimnae TaxID=3114390 RepID=UPI003CCBEB3D
MDKYYIPFFIAVAIAYLATPLVRWFAIKVGAVDVPKDDRRIHKKPMPLMGGLAIYIATIISMIIYIDPIDKGIISIMVGATIIVITGVIDDIKPLSAKVKFLAQIVAAFILVWGDIRIEFISNPFDKVDGMLILGALSTPITIFWVVGITNTLNFIDGVDGLAAGVGSIASMSLLFVASINGYTSVAIMSAIIAGSAFGFLPHNFNPAKIFMGDTGALFLGYMLSVIAIKGVMKSVAAIGIAIPILVLGIPIFDTTFAIIRRVINKKPIYEADKGHLHHRLLKRGLSQKQTVLVLYTISVFLGVSAVILTDAKPSTAVMILGGIFSVSILAAARKRIVAGKKAKERNK